MTRTSAQGDRVGQDVGVSDEGEAHVGDPAPVEEAVAVEARPEERRHRGRTIGAAVLGVLAVLMVTIAAVGVWAKATVLDTDRFTSMASDTLDQEAVQQGMAVYITDAVFSAVDVESFVTSALPDRLQGLAPTIVGGAEARVSRVVEQALGTDAVQNTLSDLIRRAHTRALDLLRGDGLADGISVQNGQIRLNLLPLVGSGLTAVQSLGLLSNVDVPELTASGNPDEQIKQLESVLNRDLPDDFGQLVVYQSDTVDGAQQSVQQAQRLLALTERSIALLVILGLLLVAATILVAPRRWRATVWLGAGLAAVMVVLRSVVRQAASDGPHLVVRPGARAAVTSILHDASSSLLRLTGLLLLLAVVAVVVGLWRERWRRFDVQMVISVAAAVIVFALVDVSILGLVLAIVAGVGAWFAARAFLPRSSAPAVTAVV